MPQNTQQAPDIRDGITITNGFAVLVYAISGWAACLSPFMRSGFGQRAFGVSGLAAMVVMYLYAAFWPCPEMVYFFAAWFALILWHRVESLSRGRERHSRYDGYPWLVMKIIWPRPKTDFYAKAACEPFIIVIAGALLCHASEPLGAFVIFGAAPVFLKRCLEQAIEDVQVRVMIDKEIEMRARAERFRNRY